jgi:hypothetical protein
MRATHGPSSFASYTVSSLTFLVLLAACGGKAPEAKAPDPTGTTGSPTAAPTAEPASSPPSTTTATLGGNDPGTKLPTAATTAAPKTDDPKASDPGRAREDIQAIIVARRDEARACYDEGLKKNPSLEGDLDIKWVIDPDGNVKDAGDDASRSTIHDKDVTACIVAIIQKVKFAKSGKGKETRTHYPYNFHPKTGQVGKGGAQPPPTTK